MEEAIAWLIGVGLAIAAVVYAAIYVIGFALAAAYTIIVWTASASVGLLDAVLGARLFPGAPWAGWAVGGALLGCGLGLWTIVPVYGLRGTARTSALAVPAALVVAIAVLGFVPGARSRMSGVTAWVGALHVPRSLLPSSASPAASTSPTEFPPAPAKTGVGARPDSPSDGSSGRATAPGSRSTGEVKCIAGLPFCSGLLAGAPDTAAPTYDPHPTGSRRIAHARGLFLRVGPDKTAEGLGELADGSTVDLMGETDFDAVLGGPWFRVRTPDARAGWVFGGPSGSWLQATAAASAGASGSSQTTSPSNGEPSAGSGIASLERSGEGSGQRSAPRSGGADGDRWTARITHIDDVARLYVNDSLVLTGRWGTGENERPIGHQPGDTGSIDITRYLRPGRNELRLSVWNAAGCCGVSGTFEVRRNDERVVDRRFARQDSSIGTKFDETVVVMAGAGAPSSPQAARADGAPSQHTADE